MTLLQILAGTVTADFGAAFFHWVEDTYLPYTLDSGIMGQIARDNELHHFVPYAITAQSPWDNMRVTFPIALTIVAALAFLFPSWSRTHVPFLITVLLVGTLANLLHRYMHERPCRRPALFAAMQDAGIIVTSETHSEHHQHPDRNYGTVFAVTNKLYDTLGIWRALEMLVPLEPQKKPGIAAYLPLQDSWTKNNMKKECPEKLDKGHVWDYHATLRRHHNRK